MNRTRQGFIFPIRDKSGTPPLCNIFIEVTDNGRKYSEIIGLMDDILHQFFEGKNIEILPVSDFDQLKTSNLHTFFIELFLDSKGSFNRPLFERIITAIKGGRRDYFPGLVTGAVARGVDFFNQEEFISNIWKTLKEKHIILAAPRRFGKTSILYHLLDHPKNGFIPLHIDLEGISDGISFVTEVVIAYNRWIEKAFEGRSEQEIDIKKKELHTSLKDDWQKGWEEFCERLDCKIIFLFDEFTSMLENISSNKEEARKLLEVLYNTIERLKEARCIITGSTLIKRVIDDIDHKNKDRFYSLFEKEYLPELSPEDGYEFVRILLSVIGVQPIEERVESILNLIGSPIPFFIQLFVLEIEKGLLRENKEPTPENIKMVYRERLLGPECKSYFRHYYDHLSKYRLDYLHLFPGLKDIFKELTRGTRTKDELRPIFKQRCPRASDDNFDRLIEYLEDEFYIKKIEGKYTFTCNLIRDWWIRHSKYLEMERT